MSEFHIYKDIKYLKPDEQKIMLNKLDSRQGKYLHN
jgi:hypothetical protein